MPNAIAIAAHPDDIEFVMGGTLLLLREAGWGIHVMNVSNGNMGSTVMSAAQTGKKRLAEAKKAAKTMGAKWHAPICDDLCVLYSVENVRRICAVIREAKPAVVLTHALADYMEDHMITARLTVTAAFARGIPNYVSKPRRSCVTEPCAVYHAMPHGQCTPTREPHEPEFFVNTTTVHSVKRDALACHASQKEWLDKTQGQESYLRTMDDFSSALGKGASCPFAEGWTRHLHYGFGPEKWDPLQETLGQNWVINTKSALRIR
jgi:N-acetylglucosamine malate deacetylase 1